MPLGVSQDGEGGVRGGVYPSQLLQGLAVLLQSLGGSLETVREGQRGEGGGWGEFGLREKGEKRGVGNVRYGVSTSHLDLKSKPPDESNQDCVQNHSLFNIKYIIQCCDEYYHILYSTK